MTDYKKYRDILEKLDNNLSQSQIVIDCNCSYGTITRAKKWRNDGYPMKKTIKKNSSESSSKQLAIPFTGTLTPVSINVKITSRMLSGLASLWGVKDYYKMSKQQLKNSLINIIKSA